MASANEIGKIIGKSISEQSTIKENLSADEADAQLNIISQQEIVFDGSITITKRTYDPQSFILDHPVQGELDSSVYVLDGGYLGGGLEFPITFPLTFASGGGEVIFTDTF